MEAEADPKPLAFGPRLGGQISLGLQRGIGGVAGHVEDDEEPVAVGAHLATAPFVPGVAQHSPVGGQDLDIAVPEPGEKLGGTLDVGEQQRHCASRRGFHAAHYSACPGDRQPGACRSCRPMKRSANHQVGSAIFTKISQ